MKYAIVDLSNLINRCRHVTMGDAYTKAGMALLILFRSLRKVHRENKVDHIVFAVDHGSWRYDVYPAYKARRKLDRMAATVDQQEENEVFQSILSNLVIFLETKTRCTVLNHKGIEADDFVARWTQIHSDDEHVIISGDSDFVQLISKNVSLYDGVNENLMLADKIINSKGESLEFSIKPANGKIKVGKPDPNFIAEDDWSKKALFIKVVRGDVGDGIFSAYPGVRFKGSDKRAGISEVWKDRFDQGYHWNNFFHEEWEKMISTADGERTTKKVKVIDEYKINQSLIDLTMQPDDIKAIMDQAIIAAVEKKQINNVGLHFLQFCGTHDLPALAKEATEHAPYLNAGYR